MELHGVCGCTGCKEPVYCFGLCRNHYGDYRITKMVKQRKKDAASRKQRCFWTRDTIHKWA